MSGNPLESLEEYSRFIADLCGRSSVERSTLIVWSDSPYTGVAEGEIFLPNGIRLRVREELDFDAGLVTSYGYEAYRHDERLFWYDDFPHPDDQSLASTFPHHKHVPPDIKHNRIPAPEISFEQPNLASLLRELERIAGS